MSFGQDFERKCNEICRDMGGRLGDSCHEFCRIGREIIDFPVKPFFDGRSYGFSFTEDSDRITQALGEVWEAAKEAMEKVTEWIGREIEAPDKEEAIRHLVERTMHERGLPASCVNIIIRSVSPPRDFQSRCRATHRFARKLGFPSGFPTFEQADHGQGVVYGAMLFRPETVRIKHPTSRELNDPQDEMARIKFANRYASEPYGAALPTFEQGRNDDGERVYGVTLIRSEFVTHRDISAESLGNPESPEARFRAIHRFARGIPGYKTGFPNFEHRRTSEGVVYGAFLVKEDAVTWRDIPKLMLFPDVFDVNVIPRPADQPDPIPFEDRGRPGGGDIIPKGFNRTFSDLKTLKSNAPAEFVERSFREGEDHDELKAAADSASKHSEIVASKTSKNERLASLFRELQEILSEGR